MAKITTTKRNIVSKLITVWLLNAMDPFFFPLLLEILLDQTYSTHFSNEIDVTFPLLDIWRTLGRNSVSRMSFIPLRCIKNRRHEANFQLILPILQHVSN